MYANIMLTVDLNSEASWVKAMPAALALCKAFGARLHLLNVVPDLGLPMVSQYFPPDFEDRMRAEARAGLEALAVEKVGDAAETVCHVAEGTVYEQIIETAERIGADLIVMQSHRPELQDYLLGPNAARVVRHSNKSVLVVR